MNRYLGLSRQVLGDGAELVIWPEASTPFYFDLDASAGASRFAGWRAESRTPFIVGTDEFERDAGRAVRIGSTTPPCWSGPTADRGDLSQDAAGAVRRVRAVQAAAVFRRAARRGRQRLLAGHRAGRLRRRRPPVQRRDLLRSRCIPWMSRAFVAAGQSAAGDDHQRRLVRPVVGGLPALRAGARSGPSSRAATWSAPPTPASAAPSIRTAA